MCRSTNNPHCHQRHGAKSSSDVGRVGILALILTESVFFSIFVVAYIFYLGKSLYRPISEGRSYLPDSEYHLPALEQASRSRSQSERYAPAPPATFAFWWLTTFALGLEFLDRHRL